jgi:hypothetical protein
LFQNIFSDAFPEKIRPLAALLFIFGGARVFAVGARKLVTVGISEPGELLTVTAQVNVAASE